MAEKEHTASKNGKSEQRVVTAITANTVAGPINCPGDPVLGNGLSVSQQKRDFASLIISVQNSQTAAAFQMMPSHVSMPMFAFFQTQSVQLTVPSIAKISHLEHMRERCKQKEILVNQLFYCLYIK